MNRTAIGASVLVVALAAAGWLSRSTVPVARLTDALGLPPTEATPRPAAALQAAGVHKCRRAGGITYLDAPCPPGSRELAADGGTLTVTSFPKPVRALPSIASAAFGGPLVKPMDPDERDRLRDKAIDNAADRP